MADGTSGSRCRRREHPAQVALKVGSTERLSPKLTALVQITLVVRKNARELEPPDLQRALDTGAYAGRAEQIADHGYSDPKTAAIPR